MQFDAEGRLLVCGMPRMEGAGPVKLFVAVPDAMGKVQLLLLPIICQVDLLLPAALS